MLPQVFGLFTQINQSLDRERGGLGIGLTIVKSLVEIHGGRVEAHSAGLGKGSTFIVELPLLKVAKDAPKKESLVEQTVVAPPPPRRILVVEDNEDSALSLAMVLKHWGHDVRTAHAGPEALVEVQGYQPNVILCDIGLPGMDGYEVAREIRRAGLKDTLILALTGYGQEEDRRRAQEAGFDNHLVKPVDPAALRRLIETQSF